MLSFLINSACLKLPRKLVVWKNSFMQARSLIKSHLQNYPDRFHVPFRKNVHRKAKMTIMTKTSSMFHLLVQLQGASSIIINCRRARLMGAPNHRLLSLKLHYRPKKTDKNFPQSNGDLGQVRCQLAEYSQKFVASQKYMVQSSCWSRSAGLCCSWRIYSL